MEIMSTKIKEDGFKVTPEWLEVIGIDLKNWPTVPEALKAKEEADMAVKNGIDLFLSRPVKFVVRELQRRCGERDVILLNCVFNYGYILGKRAERARRKKGTSNED